MLNINAALANCTVYFLTTLALTATLTLSAVGAIIHVDDDAPLGGDGSSWMTAYTYLQDALYAAHQRDEIRIATGVYHPDQAESVQLNPGDRDASFIIRYSLSIYGGYAGIGAPDPDLRQITQTPTVLSGDLTDNDDVNSNSLAENSYHVLTALAVDDSAVLDGLVISSGYANGRHAPRACGAALYAFNSSMAVRNCTFENNIASLEGGAMRNIAYSNPHLHTCRFINNKSRGRGGAIHNYHSNPVLTNCLLQNNYADQGGAIYSIHSETSLTACEITNNEAQAGGGLFITTSGLTLSEVSFSGNTADAEGGAIYTANTAPTVSLCTFQQNTAARGGAMFNAEAASPKVSDCTFLENTSSEHGGGIHNAPGATTVMQTCTFIGNQADSYGGAVFNESTDLDPSVTISDCTFTDNHARYGGGVCNRENSNAAITKCHFESNSAEHGGALCNRERCTPQVTHCTFLANSADTGGAIYNYRQSHMFMSHSRLLGNTAFDDGGALRNNESWPTLDNCLFSGNHADGDGGAMHNRASRPVMVNCTFSRNTASGSGDGILSTYYSTATLTNCVMWHASPDAESVQQLAKSSDSSYATDYCCVQDYSAPGKGNMQNDPLFVSPLGPDSIYGTIDDDLRLLPQSPCLNKGDTSAVETDHDLAGESRVLLCKVDMGAYESAEGFFFADVDGNCLIDLVDYLDMSFCLDRLAYERSSIVQTCLALFDGDADGDIDLADLALFQQAFTGP